jgi:hypothetical protein
MRRGSKGDTQQMAHCVDNIPCDCGESYISETGSPLAVRLCEHRHNLEEDLIEKSKLSK